jgi:hypothetical protein
MRVGQEYGILRLSRRNTFTESSITLLSVVTQHRRDDTFAVFRPQQSTHYTRVSVPQEAEPC